VRLPRPHLDFTGWLIAIVVVTALSVGTGFGVLLNKIDTVVSNTNHIIASGSSPTSKKLRSAATIDGDLLCAFLVPALYNHKDPLITFESEAVIRDCPTTITMFLELQREGKIK
jgi:hypothetical protein